jgi:hypothetical protein
MEILKRRILFVMLLCFLCFSCSEEESVEVASEKATLSFSPILNDLLRSQENSKQEAPELPACSDDTPAYVEIILLQGEEEIVGSADSPFAIDLVSGENFTEYDSELELEPGTYILDHFAVYNSEGELIWLAPKGGAMGDLVENSLPLEINLNSGVKKYVDVTVLCFDDRIVNEYGYLFFDILPEVIYEVCFFANYCSDAGRHYVAKYSLDLYYGTSSEGTPLYIGEVPVTGLDGEYFADPLCVAIPGPQNDEGDDEPYLYYEATLLDWEGNYGSANGEMISGTWSWNDIKALQNEDGETSEYFHAFINCDEEILECGEFEAIPESSFYDNIIPEAPVDYFEIVTYLDEIIFSFSQGELCADAEDMANCINEFDNLIAEDGFVISCLPAGCYTFIRQQTDGINQLITTDEELLEFLGSIDSKGDALLLALANDYYWSINDIENGAIKNACSGYELIVSKIVSSCAPLQINRFRLRITPSGQIIILDQEVIEFDENLCI